MCLGRTVLLASKSPCDGIQYRSLPLVIIPAHDCQSVSGRLHLHRFDTLDILDLQLIDLDIFHLLPASFDFCHINFIIFPMYPYFVLQFMFFPIII